jgi:hypothetical protein
LGREEKKRTGEIIAENLLDEAKLGIATTDGRIYFEITNLLKKAELGYRTLVPGKPLAESIKVVITSRKEIRYFRSYTSAKILCVEDLGNDIGLLRERLLSEIYGRGNDSLVIGIDPGERTGLAVFFDNWEIEADVFGSTQEAVFRVAQIIGASDAARKIVRIGNGIPSLASEICAGLERRVRKNFMVELVDEHGTSNLTISHHNTRAWKDKISARIIAFRKGTVVLDRQ